MNWQHKLSVFFVIASVFSFMYLMYYHSDGSYSWILHHQGHWMWSVSLSAVALLLFGYGILADARAWAKKEVIKEQKETERLEKPKEKLKVTETVEEQHVEEKPINVEWIRASRKEPLYIEFREVQPNVDEAIEQIETEKGTIQAIKGEDVIVRDEKGDIYAISKEEFESVFNVSKESEEIEKKKSRWRQ